MRVTTADREYTLYTRADGTWTMHEWNPGAIQGECWEASYIDVSESDPFAGQGRSSVEYEAWLT